MGKIYQKQKTYLATFFGGCLGFLIGISGISNHFVFNRTETILETKVASVSQEIITSGFLGLRTLFFTYLGWSSGLTLSKASSNQKSQHKN